MNELMVLQNKLIGAKATPAVIDFPTDEVKAFVVEYMKRYENVVYSDDVIKQVKADKSELNKIKKTINDFGIKVDKELSANIKEFRSGLKEIIAMIDEPMDGIEKAIEEFEAKRKAEKREKIVEIMQLRIQEAGLTESYASKVELKESYLNVSTSMKAVFDDLFAQIAVLKAEQETRVLQVSQIQQQVEMANLRHGLNVELKPDAFISMLDYRAFDEIKAMVEKQAADQKQSEIQYAERIRIEEERKANAAAEAKIQEANAAAVEQMQSITESVSAFVPVESAPEEKRMSVTLKIEATKAQMDALKSYMDSCGISYQRA